VHEQTGMLPPAWMGTLTRGSSTSGWWGRCELWSFVLIFTFQKKKEEDYLCLPGEWVCSGWAESRTSPLVIISYQCVGWHYKFWKKKESCNVLRICVSKNRNQWNSICLMYVPAIMCKEN
jgi:hypothetical protein